MTVLGAGVWMLAVEGCRSRCQRKAGAAQCQTLSSSSSTTDPPQDTAEPLSHVSDALVKTHLRQGRKHQKGREQREWENNNVSGRGGGGGERRCSMLEEVHCQRNNSSLWENPQHSNKNKTRAAEKLLHLDSNPCTAICLGEGTEWTPRW